MSGVLRALWAVGLVYAVSPEIVPPVRTVNSTLAEESSQTLLIDTVGPSFCARLSTESSEECSPSERGPEEVWTRAAGKWKPTPGIASAPVVVMWAAPSVTIDELAGNKNGALTEYFKYVKALLSFVEGKNADSYAATMHKQKEILDRITVRQAERAKEHRGARSPGVAETFGAQLRERRCENEEAPRRRMASLLIDCRDPERQGGATPAV